MVDIIYDIGETTYEKENGETLSGFVLYDFQPELYGIVASVCENEAVKGERKRVSVNERVSK